MRRNNTKRFVSLLLVAFMMLAMLAQYGCGEKAPETSTPVGSSSTTLPEFSPSESPTASTPEESPAESSPVESTPAESSGEPTPPESTPDVNAVYNITYDLAGGLAANGNPDTYTYLDGDITIYAPIKAGYAFAGWTGTGLSTATDKVVIESGSTGDRAYTATWMKLENVGADYKESEDPISDAEREALRDSHNSLAANPEELPLSVTPLRGQFGEGMFLATTAYTNIAVDGVMDNAYTYGLRFKLDMMEKPDLYKNRDTGYHVYMVAGQDGKMHVFVEVIDHDIVINDAMWEYKWWHCDSWQMYVDFGNDKVNNEKLYTFAAEGTKKYVQDNPENWIVVMTENGFNVEFEFDNNGTPFKYGDEFGFGFFYNDTMNYKNTNSYDRSNTGTLSVLDPKFHLSNVKVQDAVMITSVPVDADEEEEQNPGGDAAEKEESIFTDIAKGKATLGIITSKYYSAYNEINVEELVTYLAGIGVNARVVREDKRSSADNFDYVIYLNTTADAFAAEVFATMSYNDWGVALGENKMVGFGWTWDANDSLCDAVLSIFANAVNATEYAIGDRYIYRSETVMGDTVPHVEDTYCIIDSGEDAYVIVKQNTTLTFYNEYVTLIQNAGFKHYTSNTMATVYTHTYYDDETVINLLYSEADKNMRVVVESMAKTALPTVEVESYEKKATSAVTQIDLGAGLCHVIRLDSGEFIIVDSGNQGKQALIYDALVTLNEGRGKIVIAAWIFTHFHQDHIGGFCDFVDNDTYLENVQIKAVVYNPPERFFLDISKKNSAGDRGNIIRWVGHLEKLQKTGTVIYQARTGQKYGFGNSVVEIIGTFDDFAPFYMRADSSNHTSIQFTVTIEGQKLMYVGDSTSNGLLLAAKRYGDYLKSDFVQLAHHGYGDGSSDNAFYKCVNAPVVLHPGTSLSGGAERWAYNNGKETYSYGSGNVTILLPHKTEK